MGISKDERDKLLQAAQRWVDGTTQMMADEERAAEAFVKLLDELTHPDTCMCGQRCQYCTETQNEPTWLAREREREAEASDTQTSPFDHPVADWWMKQSITLKERGHDTQNDRD